MFPRRRETRWLRKFLADVRDTLVLLRQFRGALLAFILMIGIGGALYRGLAQRAGETHPASLVEGWYVALSLVFLQSPVEFPPHWYLQIFFFALPLLGLGILGQGVADLGVLLFNRQARGEAWQVAVIETFSTHIVLVGLGHLGFRIATSLHELGETFVCVEQDPEAELASQVQSWRVPIINGDALRHEVLRRAGLERAHTIVLATSDDIMNLQIAIHARAVNPRVRTIVRLFDDDFAREVQSAFGITSAYSASALAAPTFAAAAANLEVVQSVTLGGRVLNMSRFALGPKSALTGMTVDQLEHTLDLSIVLLKRGHEADLHPDDDRALKAGDEITVFADTNTLHRLSRMNE
jgi:Trk K+ transport system NAD-binding subunit